MCVPVGLTELLGASSLLPPCWGRMSFLISEAAEPSWPPVCPEAQTQVVGIDILTC